MNLNQFINYIKNRDNTEIYKSKIRNFLVTADLVSYLTKLIDSYRLKCAAMLIAILEELYLVDEEIAKFEHYNYYNSEEWHDSLTQTILILNTFNIHKFKDVLASKLIPEKRKLLDQVLSSEEYSMVYNEGSIVMHYILDGKLSIAEFGVEEEIECMSEVEKNSLNKIDQITIWNDDIEKLAYYLDYIKKAGIEVKAILCYMDTLTNDYVESLEPVFDYVKDNKTLLVSSMASLGTSDELRRAVIQRLFEQSKVSLNLYLGLKKMIENTNALYEWGYEIPDYTTIRKTT